MNNSQKTNTGIPSTTRKRLASAFGMAALFAILLGVLIAVFNPIFSHHQQLSVFDKEAEKLRATSAQCVTNREDIISRYDMLYQSKADTSALFLDAKENALEDDFGVLANKLDVAGAFVCDSAGTVIEAESDPRYGNMGEELKDHQSHVTTDPCDHTGKNGDLRFYTAPLNEKRTFVIAVDRTAIQSSISATASLQGSLDNAAKTSSLTMFSVNKESGLMDYAPDQNTIGKSFSEVGLTKDQVNDGFSGKVNIAGNEYFAKAYDIDGEIIFCARPAEYFQNFMASYLVIGVIVFLIMASLLVLFAYFYGSERRVAIGDRYVKKGDSYINRAIQRKIVPLGFGCLMALFAIALYAGSLFELSNFLVENDRQAEQTVESVKSAEDQIEFLNEESSSFLEDRAALAAFIVGKLDREQLTQNFMANLSSALRSPGIWYYDMDGSIIATDDNFWGYRLSDDPESFSYQFRQILNGKYISVVTDSEGDTGAWEDTRYAGYAVQDSDMRTVGAVEIGLDQSYLEKVLKQYDLASVLAKVQPGADGFAFAIDSESEKIAYHPETWMVGTAASEHGIKDSQIINGFSDFMKIEGNTYLCASSECGANLIYIAVPGMAPLTYVIRFVVLATLFSAIAFALILHRVLRRNAKEFEALVEEEEVLGEAARPEDEINVSMADGRIERSRSILSRWSGHAVSWHELTAGQKILRICQALVTLVALAFLILTLLSDNLFSEYSLFRYILNGTWAAGFNLFAITRCVMVALVFYAVIEIVRNIMRWFANGMGPKGETTCRLIANFLKFAYAIGMIYFCLGTLGVDTATLLTSAGILALVIGLGANSLITDILAGLFIVFENEFQVGDIVMIGDFRGTVLEIGVRTTKVKDASGNIKVFANRNVTNVLNMTKDLSVVICDMSIEYGESLEYVESILAEELPNIQKQVPQIVDGPYYKGITELADSSINLRFVAQTTESDRAQADRDLRREMKLLFDKYNINIPYPQVTINQPLENFHSANYLQKMKAERFSDEQAEAAKDVRTSDEG